MVERREDEHEPGAEPAREARFVAPPEGIEARPRRGELVLTTSSWTKGAAVLQAGLLGVAITLALAPTQEPRLAVPLVALAVLGWLSGRLLRSPGGARLSWDDWGLTLDEAGARTAIPWSAAHASVEENGPTRIVRVHDQERVIAVAQGPSSPLSGAREAKDVGPLLGALDGVPRAPAPEVVQLAPPALVVTGIVALALTVTALAVAWERPLLGVAIALVAALTLVAVHDVAAAVLLAMALRGARVILVEGAPGEPLRASLGGASVTLQVEGRIADGRLGERGEPVRAVVEGSIGDAPGPYRKVERLRVRGLESLGERKLRLMRLASGLTRGAIGLAAIVVAIVIAPAPTRPDLHASRPITTLTAPPERPSARPIAPRAAGDDYEGDVAVARWRAMGPHVEHTYRCEGGKGCVRMPVYVDPATGTRLACDEENAELCLRLHAARGLPLSPLPQPAVD